MSDDDQFPNQPAYKVGYRRPPKEHRFQQGHKLSKGRPKGSQNTREQTLRAWHATRLVMVDGKRKRLSHSEIGALNLAAKGSKGDQRAYELQIANEDVLAQKSETRIQAFPLQERADLQTMANIVERIRSSSVAVGAPAGVRAKRSARQRYTLSSSDSEASGLRMAGRVHIGYQPETGHGP